jgi:hypothetical protein
MYRTDNATSATSIPSPGPAGPNPDGFFTNGTILDRDWCNAVQEEIAGVIESTGDTLDKTDRTQLKVAIEWYVQQFLTTDQKAAITGASTPSALNVFATAADITNSSTGALNVNNLLYIEDQKPSGTNGGSSVTGQNTRDLNTKVIDNISGASLAANQITLPAGTYFVEFVSPALSPIGSLRHKARLRNISDSTTLIIGTSELNESLNQDSSQTISTGTGTFVIASDKIFELQHYFSSGLSDSGLGRATSSGDTELYARIKIWKIA